MTSQSGHRQPLIRLLRGPLVWGGFLVVGYIGTEVGCVAGEAPGPTRLFVLALAAAATALCIGSAIASYRRWRKEGDEEWDSSLKAYSDPAGALFALISAAAIVAAAVSLLGLGSCA